jgi:hypothetical protein
MITINAKNKTINVGTADFLHCFRSTISKHVKSDQAPNALNFLKHGKLKHSNCLTVAREFNGIHDTLSSLNPAEVVWDIDNPSVSPPWGDNISPVITSLGNYFLTADGKDLFFEIIFLLQYANDEKTDVLIV